ncbi:MAG: pilus assembly protein [Gemmatimonadaceae bacterium]|nr:pilus assembly protein [Gemmatimonadaceae bacterium]
MITHVRSAITRWLRDEVAGPVVEFALVVPVLLLLVFGVIDFARAFFQRNNLVSAVREGARFAAVSTSPCNATTAIRNRVLSYYSTAGGTAPAANDIQVTVLPSGICTSAPGNATNVQVAVTNYPYVPVTPLLRLFGGSAIRLQASAVYRWELSPP